jgi:hypothetical protein
MRVLGRLLKAVRILARGGRIPRPLRGLALVGLAPLPGPLDEVALLLAGALLWVFHRDRLREAWSRAAAELSDPAS